MLRKEFDIVTSNGWKTSGLNVQYKLCGETLYVQCTRGFSDWMFNLFASKVAYDEYGTLVHAHAGFASLWLSIRPEIEKLHFKRMVLYSQGAAIGTAIHFNYVKRLGVEPDTYAFGAPRYFAKKTEDQVVHYFNKFKRIKNRRDIITRVPLKTMKFIHVGMETILPEVKFHERPRGIKGIIQWVIGHSQNIYRLATTKYDSELIK